MENHTFKMLEIFHDTECIGWNILAEKFTTELSFTEDEFRVAFENLQGHNLITDFSGRTPENKEGFLYAITERGKESLTNERTSREEAETKKQVEHSILINQDKLQKLNIDIAQKQSDLLESQLQLNPLIKIANESAIKTNTHIVITNENTVKSNSIMRKILWLTVFVTLLGVCVSAYTVINDRKKEALETKIELQNKEIDSLKKDLLLKK